MARRPDQEPGDPRFYYPRIPRTLDEKYPSLDGGKHQDPFNIELKHFEINSIKEIKLPDIIPTGDPLYGPVRPFESTHPSFRDPEAVLLDWKNTPSGIDEFWKLEADEMERARKLVASNIRERMNLRAREFEKAQHQDQALLDVIEGVKVYGHIKRSVKESLHYSNQPPKKTTILMGY